MLVISQNVKLDLNPVQQTYRDTCAASMTQRINTASITWVGEEILSPCTKSVLEHQETYLFLAAA